MPTKEEWDKFHSDRFTIPLHIKEPTFELTLDEARALNFFLRLHHGLLRENEEQYVHILRLINGIGQFVDSHNNQK